MGDLLRPGHRRMLRSLLLGDAIGYYRPVQRRPKIGPFANADWA